MRHFIAIASMLVLTLGAFRLPSFIAQSDEGGFRISHRKPGSVGTGTERLAE